MRSAMSVSPVVSTLSLEQIDRRPSFLYLSGFWPQLTENRKSKLISQGQRLIQKKEKVCVLHDDLMVMAVVVGFHCDVINSELVRRCVQRGAAEARGSGGVQRVWAW